MAELDSPSFCSCCHRSELGTAHAFSWGVSAGILPGHRVRAALCLGGRCATENPRRQTQLSCSTHSRAARGKVQGLWHSELFYPFPLCSFRKKMSFSEESPLTSGVPSRVCRQGTEDGISGQFWREHSSSCQERAAGACSWAGNCRWTKQRWKLSMKTKLCCAD